MNRKSENRRAKSESHPECDEPSVESDLFSMALSRHFYLAQ